MGGVSDGLEGGGDDGRGEGGWIVIPLVWKMVWQ